MALRVTQQFAEVATGNFTASDLRVTSQWIDVVASGYDFEPDLRVTSQWAEVIAAGYDFEPELRIAAQWIEVCVHNVHRGFTSQLGTIKSSLAGSTLILGMPVSVTPGVFIPTLTGRLGSSSSILGRTMQIGDPANQYVEPEPLPTGPTGMLATINTLPGLYFQLGVLAVEVTFYYVDAVDALVLGEEVLVTGEFGVTASDTLSFTEVVRRIYEVSASDSVALNDQAVGEYVRPAIDTLVLIDEAIADVEVTRSVTDTLVLSGTATVVAEVFRSATDSLTLDDEATVSRIMIGEGIDWLVLSDQANRIQSASDTLVLSDVATVDLILGVSDSLTLSDSATCVTVFSRTSSDTLVLADSTIPGFVAERAASDTLSLVDAAVGDYCRVAEDTLVLEDEADFELVRLIADTLVLTDEATFIIVRGVDAYDTLILIDDANLEREIDVSASDALSLADQAGLLHDATDTLVITDTATADYSKVAYDELLYLTDVAEGVRDRVDALDMLALTDVASYNIVRNVSARDYITTLAEHAWPGFQRVTASDALQTEHIEVDPATLEETVFYVGLQDTAQTSVTYSDPKEAEDHLSFGEQAVAIKILAAAIAASASDSLSLSDEARTNITPTASDDLTVIDTAEAVTTKLLADSLSLSDSATCNVIRNLEASDSIVLSESVLWYNRLEDYLYEYHPFAGSGPSSAPTPPPLELDGPIPGITVPFQLVYPVTGPFSDTLTLRAPNLGNRDKLQMSRVSRETRGGTLIVYADPMWPVIQTLVLDFSGLTQAEASGLHTFMNAHLGLEIGMLDWEHRFWRGIITDLSKPVVQDGRGCKYSVGFEFEGEMATYDPGP